MNTSTEARLTVAGQSHAARQLVEALLLLLKGSLLAECWHHAPVVLLRAHVAVAGACLHHWALGVLWKEEDDSYIMTDQC